MSLFLSAWTVIAAVIFLGVTVWALRSARKGEFDQAARIPIDDDDDDSKPHNGAH